jgi:CPA2 family monovalent cation:H+ antiporter-2
VEIMTRVLTKYLVPRDEIETFIGEIRASGYDMFRGLSQERPSMVDLKAQIPDMEISSLRLRPGSPLAGQTLAEADLRKNYAVTVLAVRRDGSIQPNPDAGTVLQVGDILVVMGKPDRITRAARECETCL